MFCHPVKLALTSVSRSISRRITTDSLSVSRTRLDDRFNQLDFEVKRNGRVAKNDVLDVFNQVKSLPSSTSTHTLLLLRCCGSLLIDEKPAKRNELVDEIWSTLKSKIDVRLDISHFNALLKVYLENEREFNPLDFLKELEAVGLEPNRVTFQRLIHAYCMNGEIEGATKILEFMKTKEIAINEGVFNSLIVGYTKIGDVEAAFNTLDIMKKSGIEPSNVTYTTILTSLAEKLKEDAKAAEYFEQVFTTACDSVFMTDRMKLDILKALFIHDPSSPLIKSVSSTLQKTIGYRTDAVNVTMELLHRGLLDQALELFFMIPRDGQTAAHKVSGHFFVSHMVRCNFPPEKVLEVCSRFKNEGISLYGFQVAAEVASEPQFDRETNRMYVSRFLKESDDPIPRCHYFWPILSKCQTEKELLEVLRQDMDGIAFSAAAEPLLDTFVDYIWPKVSDPETFIQECRLLGYSGPIILTSYVEHLINGFNYSKAITFLRNDTLTNTRLINAPLMRALGRAGAKEGTPGEIVTLLKEFHLRNTDNDVGDRTGSFLIDFVSNRGHLRENNGKNTLELMLRRMAEANLSVSDRYRERLSRMPLTEKHISIINSTTGYYRPAPMTMSGDDMLPSGIDQLEDHLKELEAKKMNTRGCIRKLVLEYCRLASSQISIMMSRESDNLDQEQVDGQEEPVAEIEKLPIYVTRVKQLVESLREDKMSYSDGMKSVLFEFYGTCGDFDQSLKMREEISPDFFIDDFKIMNVARFFVRGGRVDDAFKLLREETERPGRREYQESKRESSARDTHEANVFRLVNEVSEKTKDPKKVDDVLNICLQFRGYKPTNIMLGPKIKVHLLRDDMDGALNEFASVAAHYKQTPWLGELMKRLIEKEETAKLQMITDLAIAVHGEPNVLGDLAFAFLKAGKSKQSAKVFSTVGLRGNMWKVRHNAKRMVQDKEIESLERLVSITRDISGINRDEVFQFLIRGYKAVNEPKKALNVWTMMQEEEVVASQETLNILGSFLKECGMEVPFEVPTLPLKQDKSVSRTDNSIMSEVVREEDAMKAFERRNHFLKEGKMLTVSQESILMDKLLAVGHLEEAYSIAEQLNIEGKYPNPRTFRALFSLIGKEGRVDLIKKMQHKLPAEFTNQGNYTNALAEAYLNAGQEEMFLQEVLPSLKPFPLFSIRSILEKRPELEPKVLELTKKCVDKENYSLPQNMVWIHFMLKKRFSEAGELLQTIPRLRNQIMFTSVLDVIKERHDIELADQLLKQLEKTNLSPRSLGIVVSSKLDVLVDQERPEEAEQILLELIEKPVSRTNETTGERIPPIQLTDINRMVLVRLFHKMNEKCGREPKFSIPDKTSFKREEDSQGNEVNENEKKSLTN